jgi:hypothetical protein
VVALDQLMPGKHLDEAIAPYGADVNMVCAVRLR